MHTVYNSSIVGLWYPLWILQSIKEILQHIIQDSKLLISFSGSD